MLEGTLGGANPLQGSLHGCSIKWHKEFLTSIEPSFNTAQSAHHSCYPLALKHNTHRHHPLCDLTSQSTCEFSLLLWRQNVTRNNYKSYDRHASLSRLRGILKYQLGLVFVCVRMRLVLHMHSCRCCLHTCQSIRLQTLIFLHSELGAPIHFYSWVTCSSMCIVQGCSGGKLQ